MVAHVHRFRSLGLLFLSLVLVLTLASSVASQDSDTEEPFAEAPPREWATLDVTAEAQDSLTDGIGRETIIPITITNNGNIPAVGVVAVVEGGRQLVGTPVKVGDVKPGGTVAVELPIEVLGRSAYPLPFSVLVSAENVTHPTTVPVERSFAGLNAGDYLAAAPDADLLLEQTYDRYDGGFDRPQPLLWFESGDKAADALQTIDLKPLLLGEPPKDLTVSVLYYPDEKGAPTPVEAKYDPEQLALTFAPAGEGRYLIEWSRPFSTAGVDDTAGLNGIAAATTAEPELPQGWTPSYHPPLVSDFTGSVSLSYPILTPPGAAGLQPNLGLTYSSANGNGMLGRLQADEVGFGWNNTALIDVTQALKTCHGDNVCEREVDLDGDPNTTGRYNQYTLSYNGVGYELIHAGGKTSNGQAGRYYAQGHAGLYVELCKPPLAGYCQAAVGQGETFDTQSDVFWRIKSADNTSYRLGFMLNSEQEIICGPENPNSCQEETVNVDNTALRWRVDKVNDRFGNVMTYTYAEDYYTYWVHDEYFHVAASYLTQIVYDTYTVTFHYDHLPTYAYRDQGYGHVLSWNTRYLIGITISAGSRNIRLYALEQTFQRYGTDNDDDHPPVQQPRAIANQSPWCAEMEWVYDFRDPQDPNDNFSYTPDALPMLTSIDEFGFDANNNPVSKSGLKDATFSYTFLGTGQYALYPAYVRYCFPYLTSVETLYGPADPATPTTAYTWRAAQQPFQAAGSLENGVVGRHVNVIERETTYSGFADDAPTQNVYFGYGAADMQGDDDTFQGFMTVDRCQDAACGGSWTKKETLTFETRAYSANDAALNGRLKESETRGYPNVLMAEMINTWSMLNADGIAGPDPSRVAVLDEQIQRDYRGGSISVRTKYVYDVYGNTLQTQEYGERTGATPWRTLEYVYTPNMGAGSDVWLVNLPWRETLWDGPANGTNNKIVRRTRFRYDGADCDHAGAAPTNGLLTATDAYLPNEGAGCSGAYNTTTYAYGGAGGGSGAWWQLTRVVDPAGRYTNYNWTNATQLGAATNFVGTTSYTYISAPSLGFRWQVRDVTAPNGATTRYTYDVHGRLDQVNAPYAGTGEVGATVKDYYYADTESPFYVDEVIPVTANATTRTFYDAVSRPLQTRSFNLSSDFTTAVTDTEYDTFGRVRCAAAPQAYTAQGFNAAFDCDAQPKLLYAYDVLGETISETGYDGVATTTAVIGRERRVTDAEGNLFVYESDDLGRLLRVRQPVTAAPNWTMSYTYDLADNLLKATGPNNAETTMDYDKLGRKTKIDDPDMGIWTYAYDGSGNLRQQVDQKHQQLCFYYDAANRPTSKRYFLTDANPCPLTAGGTLLANYTYYPSGAGKGFVQTISGGTGAGAFNDTFTYDYRGRAITTVRAVGGRSYTLNTTYDEADRPEYVLYPWPSGTSGEDREVVHIQYDKTLPTAFSGISNMVIDLNYNVRGQLTGINRAAGPVDTTLTYYNQSESFRLDEIQHGTASDATPNFLYNQYDNLGNVEIIQMKRSGATETQTFEYDAVSRLTSAVGTGTAAYDYDYTYGVGGNLATRVNRTPNPDQTRTYTYGTPGDHHAHAVMSISGSMTAAYTYDANGNMTSRTETLGAYTQNFDVENRLTSVIFGGQTTSFYYDADGNRILTVLPNGTKVYTPFPEYEETMPSSGPTTQRSSYFLAGQLIAVRVRTGTSGNGALYFAYADHLGSVAGYYDMALAKFLDVSLARYEPYGSYRTKPLATVNPGISDRGFTSHQMNNTGTYDLGLIYMNARYYLPEIGRFISADSIVPEPSNPQSYNRYAYVLNNPINLSDPTGHMASSGCDVLDCTQGGTINPATYRAADGTYSFADPTLSARHPSPLGKKLSEFVSADAYGLGITFTVSLDTPVAGIELMYGRESVYVRESDAATNFIVVGGAIRIGPSTSFIGSLKGLAKGGAPVNATVSPYVSAIQNVNDAVADYSGPFAYDSITAAYNVGVSATENRVPGDVDGNKANALSIGPAFGYALTQSHGASYAIPTSTRQPGQIFPTFHNPIPYIRDLATWVWSGITGTP